VRVLLHTAETREYMIQQLSETTGHQWRQSQSGGAQLLTVPLHLRVSVSPTTRTALKMPVNTIVRIRRSVPHLLRKNALLLSIPLIGILVAVVAIPGLPVWAVVAAPLATAVLAFAPLRVR
jgi:hypothetical protein